jgi:RNA polymerase sigma-70 factor (ECF subfamily)
MILSVDLMYDSTHAGPAVQELSEREERELIRRCLDGDWSEYGLLVQRYQRLAWAALDAATADKQAIPDLVQDTFVRVYEKLHTWRSDAGFSTWLYRIAYNIGLNHNRSLQRRPQQADGILVDRELMTLADKELATPDRSYSEESRRVALEQMLSRLAPKYRQVLNLHYVSGMTYTAISSVLGLPLNTVRTRLKRGRERLLEMAQTEGWQ